MATDGAQPHELRRDVTVWGSYMWGFADVGADSLVALGLVMAASQGWAIFAFAGAGLVYIMIGLAYTELAAAYPVAGGGQYFALRGLGDMPGFIAGSALLLDYTIDIALFSVASAGYFNFLLSTFLNWDVAAVTIDLGPIPQVQVIWLAETLSMIFFLTWLNIRGIRESSMLNEIVGIAVILAESTIVIMGLALAWNPDLLIHQITTEAPTTSQFMYGSSLAIISFVGLESISQAAQETRRPATIVPRTSITLIFTVFIFATAFSVLGLGVLPWQTFQEHLGDPVAVLAGAIPFIGAIAGPLTAIVGTTILLISANSGVMSVSRLVYSMSRFDLFPPWFEHVHSRFRTPARSIVVFSAVGAAEAVLAFLTPNAMDTLGNMYAFGATLGYILVFISLIRLRFTDPYSPRPYKMPFNLSVSRNGRKIDVPILGFIGTLGVSTIFFEVIITHEIGRIAGPAWVLGWLVAFMVGRRRAGLPSLGNVPRHWESDQIEVLTSAEEFELLEEYKAALAERDRRLVQKKPPTS